jgi:vitamin B12 transporter
MAMMRIVLCAFLAATVTAGPALAQSTGVIEGIVVDTSGGVLPGARIEARNEGQSVAITMTGNDGRYRFELTVGVVYELSARLEGFAILSVQMRPSGATTQDFELRIAPLTDSIIVTASSTERSRSSTAESVAVFNADDIGRLGSYSVADIVAQVPGFDLSAVGREGAMTSLFSRGGESDYNQVLIDGVRVNQNGGQFDFSRVSSAEIDRIEVIRGAQSARYGSDAIGSVIQIFTKRGSSSGTPEVVGSVEGGSFKTFRGDVRILGGALDRLDYQFGVTQRSTNGAFADMLPEKDEFDQTTVDGNFGVRLSVQASLRTGVRYSDAKGRSVGPIDYVPGERGQASNSEDLSWYVNFEGMLTSLITHRANVNMFRYELFEEDTIEDVFPNLYTILEGTPGALFPDSPGLVRTVDETEFVDLVNNPVRLGANQFLALTPFGPFFGDFPFEFAQSFRRYDIDYQLDVTWMDNQVFSAGYEYLEEKDPTEATFSIGNNAFFAQQQFTLGQWFVTAGARVDVNSRFGTEVNPKLSAGGFPVPFRTGPISSVKVFANVGRGIKNPTFGELFSSGFSDGNPDLAPERARTFDVGTEMTFADQRFMARVTVFDNSFDDQVAFLSSNPSFVLDSIPDYFNATDSTANGVELEFGLQRPIGSVTATASYALVDTEVVATTSTSEQLQLGQPLLRRPKHTGAVHVTYTLGPASVNFNLRGVGQSHDVAFAALFTPGFDAVDITVNPGYVVVNLGGQVRLREAVTVFLQIENLCDERYSTSLGYPGMPRAVYVGTRFNFGR